MTVHLDTSALVAALTGTRPAFGQLIALVSAEHRLAMSALVLCEWESEPRSAEALQVQRTIVPPDRIVAFGPEEAALAAALARSVAHPRGREIDLAVAACALVHDAALWTLNPADFDDIPGLRLV